jgi:hypothetical protein
VRHSEFFEFRAADARSAPRDRHNKCFARCGQFADATLDFLRDKVPKNRGSLRDSVAANFRVINPKDFRIVP